MDALVSGAVARPATSNRLASVGVLRWVLVVSIAHIGDQFQAGRAQSGSTAPPLVAENAAPIPASDMLTGADRLGVTVQRDERDCQWHELCAVE